MLLGVGEIAAGPDTLVQPLVAAFCALAGGAPTVRSNAVKCGKTHCRSTFRDDGSAEATGNNCPDDVLSLSAGYSSCRAKACTVCAEQADVVKVVSDRIHVGPLEIARLPRQELRTESHLPIADLAAWSRAPISNFPSPRYTITQLSVASGRYSIGSFLK